MPGLNLFAGAHETAGLFGLAMRNGAPPAPTTAPAFYRNALGIRQDESSTSEVVQNTCAWFSHTVSSLGWEALLCDGSCTTSGSLLGCDVIPTTCNDLAADVCQATATETDVVCCDTTFPYCITGILEQDGNTFTAFRCGNDALSGEMEIYNDTTTRVTSTVSSGGEPTVITITETPTDIETNEPDSTDDNVSSNPGNQDSTKDEDSSGGGSSTPIGAIVGGVIGGIALIIGVAFAIWFIRFQKKKQATPSPAGMEPYRYDQNAAGAAAGYAGGGGYAPQGGYDYSQGGGYGENPHGHYAPMGTPKPEEMQMQQQQPQQPPVEMPGYSNYGAPSELPSDGTGRR